METPRIAGSGAACLLVLTLEKRVANGKHRVPDFRSTEGTITTWVPVQSMYTLSIRSLCSVPVSSDRRKVEEGKRRKSNVGGRGRGSLVPSIMLRW